MFFFPPHFHPVWADEKTRPGWMLTPSTLSSFLYYNANQTREIVISTQFSFFFSLSSFVSKQKAEKGRQKGNAIDTIFTSLNWHNFISSLSSLLCQQNLTRSIFHIIITICHFCRLWNSFLGKSHWKSLGSHNFLQFFTIIMTWLSVIGKKKIIYL